MIETERLIARRLTMDDAEAWLVFLQDEDTLEFIPFAEPRSRIAGGGSRFSTSDTRETATA
jgi:hypothetical protein